VPATTDSPSPESDPRARLDELPPSAKLVLWQLERRGAATQGQLADETLLPRRTVRSALDALEERDLVREELYVPDARKRVYHAEPVRTA
jgi:DNA-binding MarR family transcriptional regulator